MSFAIERGSILCLLGASGSGKSSVLRLLAGLERPTSGRITIDGKVVAEDGGFVEPERRRVGMVFQDFALFPHLTVKAQRRLRDSTAARGPTWRALSARC